MVIIKKCMSNLKCSLIETVLYPTNYELRQNVSDITIPSYFHFTTSLYTYCENFVIVHMRSFQKDLGRKLIPSRQY